MTAVFTLHAGEAIVQIAAVEVPVNDLLQMRSPEAVLPGEMIVIDPDKGLEVVLYPNQAGHWGEITEKQGKILEAFGVELPLVAWPKSIQKKRENERTAKGNALLKQHKVEQKAASRGSGKRSI